MPTHRLSINDLLRAYADLDQAAEELAYFAQTQLGSLKIQFDLDTQHSNPWYHALVVQLPALDAAQQQLWQQHLAERDIEVFAPAK